MKPSLQETIQIISMENADLKVHFHNALTAFRADPAFALSPAVREWFARGSGEVILLGTTNYSQAVALELGEAFKISAVVDDFRHGKGFQFCGLPIITSREFSKRAGDKSLLAINGCRFDYSRRYFEELCRYNSINVLNFEQAVRLSGIRCRDHRSADWGQHIASHADAYFNLLDKLVDGYSRDTLLCVLLFHLTCNKEWHLHVARPYSTLYFRSGLWSPGRNESFVDCGASSGESTTALVDLTGGNFKKIWMIEPDRLNVETLNKFISNLHKTLPGRIQLHACALGKEECSLPFAHLGGYDGHLLACTEKTDPDSLVPVRTLDKLIDGAPTLIKLDIEGAELDALKGGCGLISRYRPKICASAYHRAEDILTLTDYVGALCDDYRIGLRHQGEDRFDTCLYFY
ncbi:MAG: FkbM family methyltransferase [Azoarcus sp.]|jgi:FkbM family methyltransferase|nr:FkbM family methyltransferase [Azoarcus sp.]